MLRISVLKCTCTILYNIIKEVYVCYPDSDLLQNKSCSMPSVYPGRSSLSPADNLFMDSDTDSQGETDDSDESFDLSSCSASSTDESMSDDNADTRDTNDNANGGNSFNVSNTLNTSNVGVCDNTKMHVDNSKNKKKKLSLCMYCKKLQTQLPRHLEMKHSNEEDVKKFRNLPKGESCNCLYLFIIVLTLTDLYVIINYFNC